MKEGKWWVQSRVKFAVQMEKSSANVQVRSQYDDIIEKSLG